ncbi:MAG: dinitrogenase iron-molybdenum cofactor biosynthesis protein [Ruminococcaceae bacterium]|nr:dinitrogenase iron-molybdenum cofactor biosynthesis protein [Oscillospiraceae bacterium]
MKIAVTYDRGMIFQHFGHTEFFKIYEVMDKEITAAEVVATDGNGHGALAGFLKSCGVNVLICGGIGGGAQNALTSAGILFYGGVSGLADEAVKAYLNGTLNFDPFVKCNHHEHEHGEGHTCGSHDCGSHD